jgi:hypothetical protein
MQTMLIRPQGGVSVGSAYAANCPWFSPQSEHLCDTYSSAESVLELKHRVCRRARQLRTASSLILGDQGELNQLSFARWSMTTTVEPYVGLAPVAVLCATLVALVQAIGNSRALQELAQIIFGIFRNLR